MDIWKHYLEHYLETSLSDKIYSVQVYSVLKMSALSGRISDGLCLVILEAPGMFGSVRFQIVRAEWI